jgi:Tfp pilus assembly protein PilF
MDALKKAELAKRQGGKEKPAASSANPSLELTPLGTDPHAPAFADEPDIEPAPGEPGIRGPGALPSLPQSLELLDQEFMEEAAALGQRKPEPQPLPETAPEAAPPLAGAPHRTEPGIIEPPPALTRDRGTVPPEAKAERVAAQNLFDAKKPAPGNRTKLIVLGLFGLMMGLAIGIYFWLQLQPKSSLAGRGLATAPAAGTLKPALAPAASGSLQPQAQATPALESETEAAIADAVAGAEAPVARPPQAAAAPARNEPPGATPEQSLIRVTKSTARLDPAVDRGFQSLQRGDLEAARSAYEQALKEDPRNADALHGLASTHLRQGHPDQAQELYLRALESDPKDALAQANLISLSGRIDPVQSESRLKMLLSNQPESSFLHFYLGNLYARQNRWSEAQQSYYKAMAGDPSNPDYLFNLAVSLDQMHQPKPAAQYYSRALQAAETRQAGFDKQQVTERFNQLQRQEP